MFRKIKENPFLKTLRFAAQQTLRAGKGLFAVMVCAQILSALLAPLTAVLVGKLAASIKEIIATSSCDFHSLTPWLVGAVIIAVILAASQVLVQYCSLCLGDRLTLQMQHRVTQHIASLNLELIEDRTIQDVLERAQQSPGKYTLTFMTGTLNIIAASIRILGLLGVIFYISPLWAGAIALLCIPALIANRYLSRVNFQLKRSKTMARRWARYYTSTLTNRESIPTTVTLGLSPLFLQRFKETLLDINLVQKKFYRLRAIATMGIVLLMVGILTAALIVVAIDASTGALSIAKFTAFWIAAWRMQVAVGNLGTSFFNVSESEFNIFNIKELFSIQNTLPPSGTTPLKTPCGKIELRDLSFTYRGTEHPVLKHISVTINQGETVAIVGANGSGKTTLAKCIAQLYTPTEGTILIDDLAAKEYDRNALYKATSFVTQNPLQFEASIEENIAFGDWETLENNPAAIEELAKKTQIHSTIKHMPQGYNTLLGRQFGDYDISGGQRQKLALTRALACDPSILILDEPTASLDIHTEFELYSNIRKLVHDKTTLLISHRFTTVRMADRILVLNEGELVESGTHEALIAANGTYAVMCKMYEQMGTLSEKHE
jgi:ATP-binding cassette subfamily B protein